jgi:ribose/xylose/arabinose/galactoside ABC-type transport system permease subunit
LGRISVAGIPTFERDRMKAICSSTVSMRYGPDHASRAAWVLLSLVIAALSVGAVADRASGFQGYVPPMVTTFLAWFIEPGSGIWWFSGGHVFQSFPNTFGGYAVAIIGNVAVWLIVCRVCWAVVRRTGLAGTAKARHR